MNAALHGSNPQQERSVLLVDKFAQCRLHRSLARSQ